MRTGRVLTLLFVALSLAGLGLIAWQLLLPDPLQLHARLWRSLQVQHGREALTVELARLTHQTPHGVQAGPCLRYRARVGWSLHRERRLAATMLREGLSTRLGARLPRMVRSWRRDHESRYHQRSHAEERVLLLLHHTRGFDRWLLELNRRAVVRALERRWRRATPRQVALPARVKVPAPRDVRRLRHLWRHHRMLMASAYRLSVEIPGRDGTTDRRMGKVIGLLKQWVSRYGSPPKDLSELPIGSELRMDGFGLPFDYEIDLEMVRLISPGFDGIRGTRDDQVRGFSWR